MPFSFSKISSQFLFLIASQKLLGLRWDYVNCKYFLSCMRSNFLIFQKAISKLDKFHSLLFQNIALSRKETDQNLLNELQIYKIQKNWWNSILSLSVHKILKKYPTFSWNLFCNTSRIVRGTFTIKVISAYKDHEQKEETPR